MKNINFTHLLTNQWVYPVLLIVSALAVYFPVLRNDFIFLWDDQWAVMNSYTVGGWNVANLWAILIKFYHGQYAPINEYLYLALYECFGYNPFWFHLASLLLHLANVFLAYVMLRKLLFLSGRVDHNQVNILSFLTTLIFAVHSCNVESVAWMSASKVLIYALFYFGATITFLMYLEKKKGVYYFFTLLLFALSFLGKDQAVTFPLWMLLIYWLCRFKLTDKSIWLTILPFFVLALFFGIVTMFSQSATGQGVLSDAPAYPLWQRMIYGCYTLVEYFTKSLLPFKQSYIYPFPAVLGDSLPQWLLLYPALLVVAIAGLWKYLSHWVLKFGLLFFLIHIAIVLNIIQLSRFSIFGDRYLYVAIIGIGFILSYFLVYVFQKIKKNGRTALCILFIGYIFYLGIYSNIRVQTWHDTDSLKKEIRELLKERKDGGIKN